MFMSKAWNETQRNRPPFYLEADALLTFMIKSKFYALSSRFPLYTYSDHLPLCWMSKSEKGPVSQFLIEDLAELDTVHQYIQGHLNSVPDAASRYPLLGPKRISPRGLSHSLTQLLSKIPSKFKMAKTIHVHAGSNSADVRKQVQAWASNKGSVQQHAPPRQGSPRPADLAIMVPRPEVAPVALASYLLSDIPFALMLPVDLLVQVYEPNLYPDSPHLQLKTLFDAAGKITILASQMTWSTGNMGNFHVMEIYALDLVTPVSVPGASTVTVEEVFEDPVPQTVENWSNSQQSDPDFPSLVAR